MRLGSDYTSMYKAGDDTSSQNSFMTDLRRVGDTGSVMSGSSGT